MPPNSKQSQKLSGEQRLVSRTLRCGSTFEELLYKKKQKKPKKDSEYWTEVHQTARNTWD